ncbi:MAG: hypothetical protein ACHQAY_06295 [Hyphomicrobiales bacterium]
MAIDRLRVTNHEVWGKLVKTWATGKNYLEDGNDYPVPKTIEEFKEQLATAQIFANVPEWAKSIRFVNPEIDEIVVRLPPKHMIEDTESLIDQPGWTYPIPDFYKRIFNGMDPVVPFADRLKLHAERIGDYTLSLCY